MRNRLLVIGFGMSAVQHCCDHIWLACIVRVVKISLVLLYLGNCYDLALALAAMRLGLVEDVSMHNLSKYSNYTPAVGHFQK